MNTTQSIICEAQRPRSVNELVHSIEENRLAGRTRTAKLINELTEALKSDFNKTAVSILRSEIATNTALTMSIYAACMRRESLLSNDRLIPAIGQDLPRLQESTRRMITTLDSVSRRQGGVEGGKDVSSLIIEAAEDDEDL